VGSLMAAVMGERPRREINWWYSHKADCRFGYCLVVSGGGPQARSTMLGCNSSSEVGLHRSKRHHANLAAFSGQCMSSVVRALSRLGYTVQGIDVRPDTVTSQRVAGLHKGLYIYFGGIILQCERNHSVCGPKGGPISQSLHLNGPTICVPFPCFPSTSQVPKYLS